MMLEWNCVMQGRYNEALKVLDAVIQKDSSVLQVFMQKGRPVSVIPIC